MNTQHLCRNLSMVTFLAWAALAPAQAQTYTYAVIGQFNSTGNSGTDHNSGLTRDPSGNLQGTTSTGGDTNDDGTAYAYSTASHSFTTVTPFNYTNGANPNSGVVGSGSAYYGAATNGGTYSSGTLFTVSAGTITPLYNFTGTTDGALPNGGLAVDNVQHTLYGTTSDGDAGSGTGSGTLYRYSLTAGTLTTLYKFGGTNGSDPEGSLELDSSGNNLYGTTITGGSGNGTLFQYNIPSQIYTVLASFTGTNGANPQAGVAIGPDNNLYGTTRTGGKGYGTVFKFDMTSKALTTLYSYNNDANGANPQAHLVFDTQGSLYGTTTNGGDTASDGTVFKLNYTTKSLTTLYTFDGTTGADPEAGLVRDSAGNLYGTTTSGGANGSGTLFALTVPTPVPEPSALAVWAFGLAGLAALRLRTHRHI